MRIPAGDSSTAKDASKAWERTGEGLGRATADAGRPIVARERRAG
jgi:hypothetical protein